jgi:(p)ppGpp synthase/HD superfamily hydrolase
MGINHASMSTPNQVNLLEPALQIAVKAHDGQKDKSGEPYIFHPIRVMQRCSSPKGKIVALLHDTVEDTDVTFGELEAAGFDSRTIDTLRLVTHEKGVPYDDYIDALLHDPAAVEVKIADLEDNSDIRRLKEIGVKDVERLKKYLRTHRRLVDHKLASVQPTVP